MKKEEEEWVKFLRIKEQEDEKFAKRLKVTKLFILWWFYYLIGLVILVIVQVFYRDLGMIVDVFVISGNVMVILFILYNLDLKIEKKLMFLNVVMIVVNLMLIIRFILNNFGLLS